MSIGQELRGSTGLDLPRMRRYFSAIRGGRIVTNNAASTQMPDPLLELCRELCLTYDNVHRGQSSAALRTTRIFEGAYRVIANFIGARTWREIVLYRGATEAINSLMYSLMTEFRRGDNVVTTYMEHNSNYVPWYALAKEILPRFGVRVECRLARFNKVNGELDIDDLAGLVDKKTKIVCCTGASNFLGTMPPIDKIREIASRSGYQQPNGMRGSYLLIDGAQLVPNVFVDVVESDIDFLAWSFHKMLAPVGVGAFYAKERILESMRPFHYGGDMIAQGEVSPKFVGYNTLPWRFTAGTPNILGTIMASKASEFLVRMVLGENIISLDGDEEQPLLPRSDIYRAMSLVEQYEKGMSSYLIERLSSINGLTIYGPRDPEKRLAVVSFNIKGKDPVEIATRLNERGIESRAGCHCATLAHYFYDINPPASCRISLYVYNTIDEVEAVANALKEIASS